MLLMSLCLILAHNLSGMATVVVLLCESLWTDVGLMTGSCRLSFFHAESHSTTDLTTTLVSRSRTTQRLLY